jgi:hypothetical protein
VNELIYQSVEQRQIIKAAQLAQIVEYIAAAPFAEDLLEVDELLWGGFWHFDVISPGYRLPAVELALLRAIRLDHHWPEDTGVTEFVSDLRRAILSPQAGLWTLNLAGEPCVVCAAESGPPSTVVRESLATVVWYCASTGRLHAGYQTRPASLQVIKALQQRAPHWIGQIEKESDAGLNWLEMVVTSADPELDNTAARLDAAILRARLEMSRHQ